MKVLLVNGSGHVEGGTYTALEEVAGALEKNGIETEIIQVGVEPIATGWRRKRRQNSCQGVWISPGLMPGMAFSAACLLQLSNRTLLIPDSRVYGRVQHIHH